MFSMAQKGKKKDYKIFGIPQKNPWIFYAHRVI